MNNDIPDSIKYGIAARKMTDEQFEAFIAGLDRDGLAVVFNDIRRAQADGFFKTEEDRTKDDGVVIKQSIEGGSSIEKGGSITITVNQITQLVEGTVKINLKSLTKYVEKYENVTNTITNTIDKVLVKPDKVKVKLNAADMGNIAYL